MTIISTIATFLMATLVILIRVKKSKEPTSIKKIILPPLFMSTGFSMFLYPPMQVHLMYAVESLITGMVLSIPLISTSNFEVKGKHIFLKRSKSFIFILLGLLILRLVMKIYIGEQISYYETAGLFYILAVGMIFPWRLAMVYKYKQMKQRILQFDREPI
jgi:membrane protein CcdC involved in cytochrome C biogenesis